MGWFRGRQTRVSPDQNDTNPVSPARIIPPDESPAWVGDSLPHSGDANPFLSEGDAFTYSPVHIPDPTTGGYVERVDNLGWSDGLGKAFGSSPAFDGAILDPATDPLRANAGGEVGLSTRNIRLGNRLGLMYYPDNSTDEQVAQDYAAWQGEFS